MQTNKELSQQIVETMQLHHATVSIKWRNTCCFNIMTQVGFTLLGRMYIPVHAAGHVICKCRDILHKLCDFLEELFTENTVM